MFHNCTLLEGFPKFKDHKEFLQYLLKDETYIYFEDSKTYKRIYLDDNENNIEKEMIIEKGKDPYSIIGCASLSLSFLSDKGRLYIPCPNSMSFTFSHCSSLISLPDISYWNMNNVYTISSLFDGCSSLSILHDLSKWEPITCELMSSVFRGCSSLKALPDISHWVTEKTQDIPEIFKGCSSLVSLPDISKWKPESINFMQSLFEDCSSLISLPDISKWNLNRVVRLNILFFIKERTQSLIYKKIIINLIKDNF